MKIWSMCFNATGTLLGVVGESGTVHVFKLGKDERDYGRSGSGSGGGVNGGGSGLSASAGNGAISPSGSFDSRDPGGTGGGGMEGGYEAFIDGKKKRSMG